MLTPYCFFLVYYLFSTRQRVSFSFIHLFRCYATQSKNIQNDILPYARPSLTIFRCAVQFRIHFVLAPNNNRYYCLNSSESESFKRQAMINHHILSRKCSLLSVVGCLSSSTHVILLLSSANVFFIAYEIFDTH